MQNRFIDFIGGNNLANSQDSILLGVSGGIDSMVMLQLFQKSGFKIAVAHCNFGLRGEESNGDEQFVKYHCLMNGIAFHSTQFNTHEYANENKLSTQVAARELRYSYFDEVCKENKYTKIAIAHNLNDVSETVLLNLTRGTGIKGLAGIKALNGNIIRPLLFATRVEIEAYSREHEVKYREDSSNATVKYKRNFIRHKIIPELRNLNPSVDRAIAETANHLQEAVWLIEEQISRIRQSVITYNGDTILFSVDALGKERSAKYFLIEELGQYGFTPSTASQVVDLLNSESGRRVESSTHVVYRDRNSLILCKKEFYSNQPVSISADTRSVSTPINLSIEVITDVSNIIIDKNPDVALIDFDKLTFPLTIRAWQDGDRFIPLGMKGFKKISDFLIDIKIPLHKKNSIYVLFSGEDIVWLVGYRIDNRFKLDNDTKSCLKLQCL